MDTTMGNVKHSRSLSCSPSNQPPEKKNKTEVCENLLPTTRQCSIPFQREADARYLDAEDLLTLEIGAGTRGHWVGPMDPALFVKRFLPQINSNEPRPDFQTASFASVINKTDTREISEALVDKLSPFSSGLKLINFDSTYRTLWNGVAVDPSNIPISDDGEAQVSNYSQIEISWVLKLQESQDPFSDLGHDSNSTEANYFPFEHDTDAHHMTRGQIGSCLFLAGSHFRLHTFAFLICGKWARLIRGDRAGAIVTRRFDFAEEDHLVEFFWRYSHTPPGSLCRGHDPTLQPLSFRSDSQTPEETVARTKLAQANKDIHREFRIIAIPDRDINKEYEFIISYPLKCTRRSPFGRATKPMLAFDRDKNMMVFVKDYWRSIDDSTLKEGETYRILANAGVPHISPFGKGNDVRNHITLTDRVATEDWVYPTAKMKPLRHYRMSLEEIGYPLITFESSHELVTAVADAMEAHEVAFHDAGILHRDISVGNILITEQGRGMLVDWDLSLKMQRDHHMENQPKHVGTPEFWSVFLLTNPRHVQGVLDDQESSLYVLLWNLLRYTPHNKTATLRDELQLFNVGSGSGYVSGDVRKELFLYIKHTKLHFDDRPRLNSLIEELAYTLYIRYERPIAPGVRKFLESCEAMKDDPSNYVVRERRLADRSWLVKTMRKYLEPRHEWPSHDQARRNSF